jgi:hypothetical protein
MLIFENYHSRRLNGTERTSFHSKWVFESEEKVGKKIP